jgi:hypothetical protein
MAAISTSIDDELKDAVYQEAERRGQSIAEFVRQALTHYLERIKQMVCATCYKCGKESYVEFEAAGIDAVNCKYVFDCGCVPDTRIDPYDWSDAMDEVEVTLSDRVRACPHCAGEECSH